MKRSTYLSLFSFLLLIFLFIYSFNTFPSVLRQDVTVEKLSKNSDYYEGKEIKLGIRRIAGVGEQRLILRDWHGNDRVNVLTEGFEIGDLEEKNIVTVEGVSYLNSKEHVRATSIHVKKNYFWRMYISPFALFFTLFLMYKEKVLIFQTG